MFEKKFKALVKQSKLDACLLFYVPKNGDVNLLTNGFCAHEIIAIAKDMSKFGKELLKEEKNAKGNTKKRNK